eukprot:CAMPEP_0184333704 /NCGR_PEP_ID=MMETSP1089-20130417/2651_1 /TAXON_ID=38269 ORGANISM="Gloeochaete wittrockiana, Strain SAG46.84" /NCGR_SAMPLE_ID=MMETSP1089 /ASSEMBLY_ACC=CAM_ASM_000445 /LENGTH=159 /DNA_ID=CAMNT_0026657645 /DNA_START=87 /DNA_END=567 /DNA_ORIENTATION=+
MKRVPGHNQCPPTARGTREALVTLADRVASRACSRTLVVVGTGLATDVTRHTNASGAKSASSVRSIALVVGTTSSTTGDGAAVVDAGGAVALAGAIGVGAALGAAATDLAEAFNAEVAGGVGDGAVSVGLACSSAERDAETVHTVLAGSGVAVVGAVAH